MISKNRKAFYDYFIEDRYEAGMVLQGWEVKAIRAKGMQITEAHVKFLKGELFLIGAHVSPLIYTAAHVRADPLRIRKLLLHREEIKKLHSKVEQKGYTIVPLNLHFSHGVIKLEIGLAKGKKQHDKREAIKKRDLDREVSQTM